MYEYLYRIYMAIIDGTDDAWIRTLLLVLVSVAPAYALIIKDRISARKHDSAKQEKDNEREKEIVTVIKEMSDSSNAMAREFSAVVAENTAVISTLKDLLQNHGAESKIASARIHEKLEQVAVRLHDRIDGIRADTSSIKSEIVAIKSDTAMIKELLKQAESWRK